MSVDLPGCAVVAGGSAGIGLATAERLAARGYRIALLARDEDRVKQAATEVSKRGNNALGIACDVANAGAVMEALQQIVQQLGEPTVWVNSAMLTAFCPFMDLSDAEFERIIDVTFIGQVNGTRAALSVMRQAGKGHIVNIGSGLAYRPVPLQSAYCAAKHAINGFTSAVRSELLHDKLDGIKLSLVQLPAVNTPQFDWARHRLSYDPRPAAPVYQPEVAADAVVKVLDSGAREVLVGRSVLQLVFGDMLLPGVLDKVMASSGYEGQHSKQPAHGVREGNLEHPVAGNVGAHGSWDHEAADSGMVVDADRTRLLLMLGAAIAVFLLGVVVGIWF